MFKHILVPTDGSKLSEKAIKHAMQLASQLEARVTAMHVVFRPSSNQLDLMGMTASEYDKVCAENAQKFLQYAMSAASAVRVACDTKQATSDHPYEEIIKAAQKNDCDLILMASHGRRGIKGFLLGSETQKVLTHSSVPVLVYR